MFLFGKLTFFICVAFSFGIAPPAALCAGVAHSAGGRIAKNNFSDFFMRLKFGLRQNLPGVFSRRSFVYRFRFGAKSSSRRVKESDASFHSPFWRT